MQKTVMKNLKESFFILMANVLLTILTFLLTLYIGLVELGKEPNISEFFFPFWFCFRYLILTLLFDKYGVYEELKQKNYFKIVLFNILDILLFLSPFCAGYPFDETIVFRVFYFLQFSFFSSFFSALIVSKMRYSPSNLTEKQQKIRGIIAYLVLSILYYVIIEYLGNGR